MNWNYTKSIYWNIINSYSSNWYKISLRSRQLLKFTLLRTIKPCRIKAGKMYIMSMENFSSVSINTSYRFSTNFSSDIFFPHIVLQWHILFRSYRFLCPTSLCSLHCNRFLSYLRQLYDTFMMKTWVKLTDSEIIVDLLNTLISNIVFWVLNT